MERTLLSAVCIRPFRCVDCNCRFFRWSVRKNVPLGQTGIPNRPDMQQPAETKRQDMLGGDAARFHLNLS